MLAETLGNRDGLSKEHLLVLAEELFVEILGPACAHHARGEHNDVLLVGIGARERPLEGERIRIVAHGNENAVGLDLQRGPADSLRLLKLKVLLHLLDRYKLLLLISVLRNGEDDKEGRSKGDTALRGNTLGKQIDNRCRKQDQEDREQTDGQFR